MYRVALKTYIDHTNINDVARLWDNPFVLLQRAQSIKNLRILKREKNKLLTRWEIDVEGAQLSWYEEDVLERDKGIVKFQMREGDFGNYWGFWRILPSRAGKIKLELKAHYDWGLTVLEPHVKRMLEKKTKVMLKSFLRAIKETLEKNE